MIIQIASNQKWLQEKHIDFSKLHPAFMPNLQKEKDCYKKAIIHFGRDAATGKRVPDTTWVRDPKPGELAYYDWLKRATDDDMKYNPAKDEKGNPIKASIKHIEVKEGKRTECRCHKCNKPIVENYYCDECDPNSKAKPEPKLFVINPNIDN